MRKWQSVLAGAVTLALVIYAFFLVRFTWRNYQENIEVMNREAREFMNEYAFVGYQDSLKSSFSRKISKHGASYLQLSNGRKIAFKMSRNFNYSPFQLCEFLQHNDSIVKPTGSNVITIYRDDHEYYFKLDGDVMEGETFP